MDSLNKILEYQKENRETFRKQWFEALRIPSISALPEHQDHVRQMANWLLRFFQKDLRFQAELIEGEGHPLVFAESPRIPNAPTVLIYGHYDVQPIDPVELWQTPPFEPTVKNDRVYCRGADDDKGQFFTHLFCAKSILEGLGRIPLNLKFIAEGEEEVGSDTLSAYLQNETHRQKLAADLILVSDCTMIGRDQPSITYGLRGLCGMELRVKGPNRDLHSGVYGGSVLNPIFGLTQMLAQVMDENGRIQIPGFYDEVLDISKMEHEALGALPFDEKKYLDDIGVSAAFGERNYTINERRVARPSFDINGISGGYEGEGSKTVIPSTALAKLTFRLVPNQEPQTIFRKAEQFFQSILPAGLTMDLEYQHGGEGMVVSLESDSIHKAALALEETFGTKPSFIREGGSIPIIAELRNLLNAELLLIGFGLDEDAIHSPNESFALRDFYRGIETGARLLMKLAATESEA